MENYAHIPNEDRAFRLMTPTSVAIAETFIPISTTNASLIVALHLSISRCTLSAYDSIGSLLSDLTGNLLSVYLSTVTSERT